MEKGLVSEYVFHHGSVAVKDILVFFFFFFFWGGGGG